MKKRSESYPRVRVEGGGRGVVVQAGSVLLVETVRKSGLRICVPAHSSEPSTTSQNERDPGELDRMQGIREQRARHRGRIRNGKMITATATATPAAATPARPFAGVEEIVQRPPISSARLAIEVSPTPSGRGFAGRPLP